MKATAEATGERPQANTDKGGSYAAHSEKKLDSRRSRKGKEYLKETCGPKLAPNYQIHFAFCLQSCVDLLGYNWGTWLSFSTADVVSPMAVEVILLQSSIRYL